jgi:hypothetical protein
MFLPVTYICFGTCDGLSGWIISCQDPPIFAPTRSAISLDGKFSRILRKVSGQRFRLSASDDAPNVPNE